MTQVFGEAETEPSLPRIYFPTYVVFLGEHSAGARRAPSRIPFFVFVFYVLVLRDSFAVVVGVSP
jgi:hypothetical protein